MGAVPRFQRWPGSLLQSVRKAYRISATIPQPDGILMENYFVFGLGIFLIGIMFEEDVRWEQRFSNFRTALAKLKEAVDASQILELSELEKEGLIHRFEYTYELAWKTLQDLLRFKGYTDIAGPVPVISQAFQDGYLENGPVWMQMKKARDLSSHTYNEETAEGIAINIISAYYQLFRNLEKRLESELKANNKKNDSGNS
jgi:nucleotidyltransferase substrate binding protein (TIGR01987 family)